MEYVDFDDWTDHPAYDEERNRLVCPVCDFGFLYQEGLIAHLEQHEAHLEMLTPANLADYAACYDRRAADEMQWALEFECSPDIFARYTELALTEARVAHELERLDRERRRSWYVLLPDSPF